MSKKGNNTETSGQDQEKKIITRYDRRIQRRKEQEEKLKRDHKITMAVSIAILVAVVVLVLSFPIRNYLAVHSAFIKVGDENVTRVEFDYNYHVTMTNYYNQMGYLLSYMGVDFNQDLSTQMYSDSLTWEDYLQQLTVDRLKTNQSLRREAKEAGFTYDTTEDFKEFQESVQRHTAENGISVSDFLKSAYGSLATMDRLEEFVREDFLAAAYQAEIAEAKTPTDEEINAYYEENKNTYDSVDYRAVQVDAVLPTEPTELADPVDETETQEDGAEDAEGEEEAYQPSQAEIDAAMEKAHAEALEKEKTIEADCELSENVKRSDMNYHYSDWLMDESRQDGETTVIQDDTNHRYYVLQFVRRYRDDSPTASARVITTQDNESAEAVMAEWESGEATESRFIELFHQYSTDNSMEDGLYEGIEKLGDEAMDGWLYDPERQAGDVGVINSEENGHYVMYYLGESQPEWYHDIKNSLLNTAVNDYLEEIVADCEVEDPKGNLKYLIVQSLEAKASEEAAKASEEAAQSSTETAASEDGTESTAAETESDSTEGTAAE